MAKQLSANTSTQYSNVTADTYTHIRRHRLMQISLVTAIGLMLSLTVARSITITIFASGLGCLLLSLGLAYKHKILTSAYVLLGSMAAMLFALAVTGAGAFDLAILGYPGLLIFAAILGGVGLFLSVLLFVIAQCVLLTWLTLEGVITPHIPSLSWPHLLFIVVIFAITGFSVYILVYDIKRLMLSLQRENAKVQRSRAKIQHLAHHDPLTDLPNRLFGEALFREALVECDTQGQKLALLFLDLDNFKPVNDALGHAAGDKLLQQLTQRLKDTLPDNSHLIRFGGDEFLVLVPYTCEHSQLANMAQALIKQSASVFEILQTQVVVSASMGIARAPEDGNDFKQLCRKADIAMYKAKEDGRNTYQYYDPSLDKDSEDKFKLLQLLRPAIEQQQFELYYQPMVNLDSGEINTVEALLRWPQADGSMISPAQFIPLTETSGLINELGHWVLQRACGFCAAQRRNGFVDLRVAVNLSVVQFKSGQLKAIVESALKQSQLPPQALELELTESLLIDDTVEIQQQLNELSQLGITLAIDDFGTGYSNLGYLRHFNASKLKIDRSFIRSIQESEDDEPLVKAIINMASSLGMKTVAEGIEDKVTLNKLIAMGCDIGQGFYWSKPVAEQAVPQLLTRCTEQQT